MRQPTVTTSTGTIDGDATDKGFEKQITVLGLGNRIDRPLDATGNVTGALKAGPLQMVKQIDTTYDPGSDPSTLEKIELAYIKFQWTDLIAGATGSAP